MPRQEILGIKGSVVMIRVVQVHDIHFKAEGKISTDVRTYNIVSNLMSDDCLAFSIGLSSIIWLTNQGFLGEIESIYPRLTDKPLCKMAMEVQRKDGVPQIDIVEGENYVSIEAGEQSYTLWLTRDKVIDLEIVCGNISFLTSKDELAAISCKEVTYI